MGSFVSCDGSAGWCVQHPLQATVDGFSLVLQLSHGIFSTSLCRKLSVVLEVFWTLP